MILLALALLAQAEPITPATLLEATQAAPKAEAAEVLAARVRAGFPAGTDFKGGKAKPLIDQDTIAFVLEARPAPAPRVVGPMDHGRGLPMVRLGETTLWVAAARVPAGATFTYEFEVGRRFGRG